MVPPAAVVGLATVVAALVAVGLAAVVAAVVGLAAMVAAVVGLATVVAALVAVGLAAIVAAAVGLTAVGVAFVVFLQANRVRLSRTPIATKINVFLSIITSCLIRSS